MKSSVAHHGIIVNDGSTSYGTGIGVYNEETVTVMAVFEYNNWIRNIYTESKQINSTDWFKYIIETSDNNLSVKIIDKNDNVIFNHNTTFSVVNKHFNLFLNKTGEAYLKNIILRDIS